MESYNIYTKYKSCINNACSLFRRYEKYHNCFNNGVMDSQMNSTFYKIVVSYSKMTDSIIKLIVPNREKSSVPDSTSVDGKALFLEYTLAFIEKYEGRLIQSFKDENECEVNARLFDLEYNVNNAGQLVNKMEGILKSSQHIYPIT